MELREFPNCCGAGLIMDLYYNSEIEQQLKDNILQAKANTWGILLGITNKDQINTAAIMEKLGFQKLFGFNNPGHESWLTLWMIDLEKVDAMTFPPTVKEPITFKPFTSIPVRSPSWMVAETLLKTHFER